MTVKNTLKSLLLAVAVSGCLNSCSDNGIIQSPDTPTDPDGKCYMSLRFDIKHSHSGNGATRTYEPTYADEDFERSVSDFRIFLVKKDDLSAPVVELKDIPMLDAVTTKP